MLFVLDAREVHRAGFKGFLPLPRPTNRTSGHRTPRPDLAGSYDKNNAIRGPRPNIAVAVTPGPRGGGFIYEKNTLE